MKLPVVSGKKIISVLVKKWYYIRSQKGNHVHLRHLVKISVTVPNHRVIAKGTLKEIMNATGLHSSDLQ
ncbi:MAG: type II toxin-antitoxin system HicA family toxin [archaeon]|nr:type II toxin-antitoxin system HicA family toxin [archaeon]